MNKKKQRITGACHCGNLSFELTTQTALDEIVARSCECSFCQKHGATYWADSEGSAIIRISDERYLQKYRFGLRGADFYICRVCGNCLGAVLSDEDGTWSVVNLRLTELDVKHVQPVSFEGEDLAGRVARRKRSWTPTTCEHPTQASQKFNVP